MKKKDNKVLGEWNMMRLLYMESSLPTDASSPKHKDVAHLRSILEKKANAIFLQ